MNKYFQKSDWLLAAAGMIGISYFIFSYSKIYSESVAVKMMPREEASKLAEGFLKSPGILVPDSLSDLHHKVEVSADQKQIRYLQELLGAEKAHQVMASEIPAYTWRLRWYVVSSENIRMGRDQEDNASETSEKNSDEKMTIQFDGAGHLIYYSCRLNETKNPSVKVSELDTPGLAPGLPSPAAITPDSARKIAAAFVQRLGWLDLGDFSEPELKNSNQNQIQSNVFSHIQTNEFSFVSKQKKYGTSIVLRVGIQDASVSLFDLRYQVPPDFVPFKERPFGKVQQVTNVIVILLSCLAIIIFFFKQFRTGAFDIKLGVFFGVITFITFGVMMYAFVGTDQRLALLMIIIFGGSWWMLATGLAIAVSGSLARDVWPEKYQTFEAIRRGKFFNRKFGLSLLRGILWACILSGTISLILKIIPQTSVTAESENEALFGQLGAVFIICAVIWNSLLNAHAVWLLALVRLPEKN